MALSYQWQVENQNLGGRFLYRFTPWSWKNNSWALLSFSIFVCVVSCVQQALCLAASLCPCHHFQFSKSQVKRETGRDKRRTSPRLKKPSLGSQGSPIFLWQIRSNDALPPQKTVCLRRGSGTCRHCSYALWQQLMLSHHGGDTSGCHRPFHIPHSVCPSMSFHLLSGCCTFLCTSALYLPISLSNPCHILLRQRYGPCVTGCESDGCYRNSRLWPELCLHSLPVFTPFHTDTGNGLSHGSNASWKRGVRKGGWLDVCVWMCVFGRWWLRWTLNH